MKFSLFPRRFLGKAALDRQGQAEKLLSESLRMLGQVCSKLADHVEAQRLSRAGYAEPGRFLERTDRTKK